MASKAGAFGKGVKFAVKYGPHVVAAAKLAKEPAQAAAQKAWDNQRNRRAALAQAATVADGSVLKVFHDGLPFWVVFSGDDVVATVPVPVPAGVALEALLAHADLTQRTRPHEVPSAADRIKALVPRHRAGTAGGSGDSGA